jgi:kynurenine formamidase
MSIQYFWQALKAASSNNNTIQIEEHPTHRALLKNKITALHNLQKSKQRKNK